MFQYVVIALIVLFMATYTGVQQWGSHKGQAFKFISPLHLVFEAAVVGGGLTLLFFLIHMGFMRKFKEKAMTDHKLLALQLFLAGALFHGLFEITTGNWAYCSARIE
mgnify:CR=1 FL=1